MYDAAEADPAHRNTNFRLRADLRAAKMQVLGLAALKSKLGPKWDRLSGLVHRLFETAVRRVQGPNDHFFALDELSYVVTFGDLSVAETEFACTSIACDICRMLFGEQIDEISVRSLVSGIVALPDPVATRFARRVESILEESGKETVVTQSIHSGSHGPVVTISGEQQNARLPLIREIGQAHDAMRELGFDLAFVPVWELRKNTSSTLFLVPQCHVSRGPRALDAGDPRVVAQAEITLLKAAAAYAGRIHEAGQICAVGVGVSYGSLSVFQTRIAYITALQKLRMPASSPLILKIGPIPEGTPVCRIADLVAMLRLPNVRVIVSFCGLASMPELDVQIGAAGFGGPLPKGATAEITSRIAEKLARRTLSQRGFTFLDQLDCSEQLCAARNGAVRFGTGTAFGAERYSGLEDVPSFPLLQGAAGQTHHRVEERIAPLT
ncbi:MAG: hypothetical protein ABSD74_11940 [Rhizomicrobium sp.]